MSDSIYKAMIVEPGEIVEMVPGDHPPNSYTLHWIRHREPEEK